MTLAATIAVGCICALFGIWFGFCWGAWMARELLAEELEEPAGALSGGAQEVLYPIKTAPRDGTLIQPWYRGLSAYRAGTPTHWTPVPPAAPALPNEGTLTKRDSANLGSKT